MFLSIVLLVNLSTAELLIEHPELNLRVPVIVGKTATPTPKGVFTIEKATSKKLGRLLIFKQDDKAIWAIHENLDSRKRALQSATYTDNKLSAGCVGVSEDVMDILWDKKQTLVLQTYSPIEDDREK